MDPRDKVHLQLGVLAGVHLVELIGELEDEFMVLDLEGLVGAGILQADRESHRTRKVWILDDVPPNVKG